MRIDLALFFPRYDFFVLGIGRTSHVPNPESDELGEVRLPYLRQQDAGL